MESNDFEFFLSPIWLEAKSALCGAVPAGTETLWCLTTTTSILTDGSCQSWKRCWWSKTQRSVDSFQLLHMQNTAKPNHTFTITAAVVAYVGVTSPQGVRWTPSKMIHRLGKEINNPESICYWAYKVSVVQGVKKRTFEDVASPSSKCHTTRVKLNLKLKGSGLCFRTTSPCSVQLWLMEL